MLNHRSIGIVTAVAMGAAQLGSAALATPGAPEAARALTRACLVEFKAHRYQNALDLCRRGLDAGDRDAAEGLGKLYEFGRGVPTDFATAVRYETMCAETPNCAHGLGWMYWRGGHGLNPDYGLARRYYGMASARGNADSSIALGMMAALGHGGPRDYATARQHFEKAVYQGSNWAADLAKAFRIARPPEFSTPKEIVNWAFDVIEPPPQPGLVRRSTPPMIIELPDSSGGSDEDWGW